MKKIIVSSIYLRRRLKDADIDLAEDRQEFKVVCQNKYITIDKVFNMSVESNKDFEAVVTGKGLKRLSRITGMIEDQPITISFDGFDNINICIQL